MEIVISKKLLKNIKVTFYELLEKMNIIKQVTKFFMVSGLSVQTLYSREYLKY